MADTVNVELNASVATALQTICTQEYRDVNLQLAFMIAEIYPDVGPIITATQVNVQPPIKPIPPTENTIKETDPSINKYHGEVPRIGSLGFRVFYSICFLFQRENISSNPNKLYETVIKLTRDGYIKVGEGYKTSRFDVEAVVSAVNNLISRGLVEGTDKIKRKAKQRNVAPSDLGIERWFNELKQPLDWRKG